jgi:hypothetical protein
MLIGVAQKILDEKNNIALISMLNGFAYLFNYQQL